MAPIKVTDIGTVAGLNLWEWFESDALPLDEFGFKTGYEAILAIESEVLAIGIGAERIAGTVKHAVVINPIVLMPLVRRRVIAPGLVG